MNAKFQKRIQRYGWDKAANYYETYWQAQLAPAQQLLLDMANLKPGQKALDIACGTGLVTFPAAKAVTNQGSVTGTDISEGMLKTAQEIALQKNIYNTEFAQMDAEAITFADGIFDTALCSLGLMYTPDPLQAAKEMWRTLKPGGLATASVWGYRQNCGWAAIFPIVDVRVTTDVCPMFFQLGGGELLKDIFESAGFVDVKSERLSVTLFYETGEAACGAAFAGGPVALAYAQFDEKTREEAHREYLDSIEPFRKADGYHIPGEFVVVQARKPQMEA